MKALIFGSDHTAALEKIYAKYLNQAQIVSEIFPAQQIFLQHYQKSIFNKLSFRAGFHGIYDRINAAFQKKTEKYKPDFVWVFKGMEMLPETLAWIKNRGIRVINFNPDNPFIFSGRGSGNANVTESITLFDHYLTYDHEVLGTLREKKVPSSLLPFGYDYDEHALNVIYREVAEKNRACFIGMPDKYRGDFLKQLLKAGIPLDVYGNRWNKTLGPTAAGIFPAQYGNDFLRVLCSYRVQLNYMRPHNLRSHNMRTFELAGAGAIQLAPRTTDHTHFFKENSEIFLFGEMDECIHEVKKLLAFSTTEAAQVRHNVRERCHRDGYSYRNRTDDVIAVVKNL